MKRVFILVFTVLLLSVGLISSGFAFYNFSDIHKIDDITTNFINAKFNEINNDYYRIYFFASPYYATGADGFTSVDPLVIADSENNPYKYKEDPYLIGGPQTTNNKQANIFFPDGSKFYFAAKEIDNEKLNSTKPDEGNGSEVITKFNKCDFTGFIRENDSIGITQREYNYVSITVKGSISSSLLASVIAGTEFKDQYGFGPEFVGWTYDKETSKKRAMYDGSRYKDMSSLGWKVIDNRGWGDKGTPYGIGNYGCQGEISQISENTSLNYLDNLASTSDSTTAVDGSKLNDHIIYLYPVFEAKNYSSDKSIGGVTTPFLKFRINPDNDLNSDTFYAYKQLGEIDYSKKRYTVGLFQNEKDNNDDLKINYYTKGIYIDTTGKNDIKNIQIDANNVGSNSSWRTAWNSIITYQELKELNLEPGYYNIDINFMQYNITSDIKSFEKEQNTRVTNLVQKFKNTNKYVAVYGSKQNNHRDTYGLYWLLQNYEKEDKDPTSYVIGFQKIDEYHVTGNNLNGSINDYSASGYKKIFITDIGNAHTQYYTIDRIYLTEGDEVAVLNEDCSSLNDVKYYLDEMTNIEITNFNKALKDSNHTVKNPFSSLGEKSIIVDKNNNTSEGNVLLSLSEDSKKVKALASGNFSLVFCFELENGLPTSINIGYRKNDEENTVMILNQKPSDDIFIDYDSLIKSSNYFASHESDVFAKLSLETPIFCKDDNSINNFDKLFTYCENNNKQLIDTATGLEVTRDIFASRSFILNRSFVLYLKDKII